MTEPYTPGPWKAYALDVGNDGTKDSWDLGAGLGWDIDGPPEPQLRGQFAKAADAYLIAAAPDLLEACDGALKEIRSLLDTYGLRGTYPSLWGDSESALRVCVVELDTAIFKARGYDCLGGMGHGTPSQLKDRNAERSTPDS